MARLLGDSDRLRRCRWYHPDGRQCEGEETEVTSHIEDHWAKAADGMTFHWKHEVAVTKEQLIAQHTQVGGDHYSKFKIQPWQIWEEYQLGPWAANALKYLLRAGHKGPMVEDLKKARHYLDYMIEREERRGQE